MAVQINTRLGRTSQEAARRGSRGRGMMRGEGRGEGAKRGNKKRERLEVSREKWRKKNEFLQAKRVFSISVVIIFAGDVI